MAVSLYPTFHAAPPPPVQNGLQSYFWYGGNDACGPFYNTPTGEWVFFMLCTNLALGAKDNGWQAWTTPDFKNWKPLGLVLKAEDYGFMSVNTGCAFLDAHNAWGYGAGSVLLVATIGMPDGVSQPVTANTVGLFVMRGGFFAADGSVSKPEFVKALMTWQEAHAQGLPLDYIEEHPSWTPDFRDSRVTYDAQHEQWVMVVSCSYGVAFFTCKNPATDRWMYASYWQAPGTTLGQPGGVECPTFDCVNGQWVLTYSDQANQFQTYNGQKLLRQTIMECLGTWDGKTFQNTTFPATLDLGWSHYAQATFLDLQGELCVVGWLANWDIQGGAPTEGWRSAQLTCVRKINVAAQTLTSQAGAAQASFVPTLPYDSLLEGLQGGDHTTGEAS